MAMEQISNLINKLNINKDNYIILACSYGPDSMVLLDILRKLNFKIVVAHVNHKLRKESDEEEILLKEYSKKNNLIFELKEINEYPEGNFEMNARIIRYDFFKDLIKKYNAKYLFTAHHGDDLIETILMRIIRGSSFKGHAGFNAITEYKEYTLMRPLIYMTKEDILSYAKEYKIPYAIDYTNKEDSYFRNRLRNNVIPLLKEENKNIHLKFIEFNNKINEYEDYFNKETLLIYNNLYKEEKLDLDKFNELNDIFKVRILQKILSDIYKEDIINIYDNHLNLILNLIKSKTKNTYINLPNNLKVIKRYKYLTFTFNKDNISSYIYKLDGNIHLSTGNILYNCKDDNDTSNYIIRLNSREINLPLFIRTRNEGDIINVKNKGGNQKISKIFIDNKLTKEERDSQPIVVDNNEKILWIPGIKKSVYDKQKNETYDIIIKYVKRRD